MSQHILIIDDDDTPETLELVLQSVGYETVGHADHATAYDRIQELHPDLVITDLMDGSAVVGWNTLMAASLDPDTQEIPVLLMSSNSTYLRNNRQYLQERGCDTLEKAVLFRAAPGEGHCRRWSSNGLGCGTCHGYRSHPVIIDVTFPRPRRADGQPSF